MVSNNNVENKIIIKELKIENDKQKMKNLEIDKLKQEIIKLNKVIISNNDSDEILIKELKSENDKVKNDKVE